MLLRVPRRVEGAERSRKRKRRKHNGRLRRYIGVKGEGMYWNPCFITNTAIQIHIRLEIVVRKYVKFSRVINAIPTHPPLFLSLSLSSP
jgi:gamma-glutamyl:cysteine ligase YbdK (ATP-grasp superfamily)